MSKQFVALAGNIGSGKTTAAKLISTRFGYELFDEPVIDNRFLRDYYGDMKRWSFTLQLEFLMKRAQHHELIRTVPKSSIQDRTLIEDPEIFAKYLHGLGHMDDRELDLYLEYFQRLNRDLHQPEKVIFLSVKESEVLLKRIRERARKEEAGLQREFLDGLGAYYSTFPQVAARKYKLDVMTLDVTTIDIRTAQGKEEFLDRVSAFLKS
jgi:deoxyadenosine/deoxycytidine kinase